MTLGRKYKWINLIAVLWVIICVITFCLPFTPAAVPFSSTFSWSAVNYAPLVTIAVMLAVTIWYALSAIHTFTGPVRTVDTGAHRRRARRRRRAGGTERSLAMRPADG